MSDTAGVILMILTAVVLLGIIRYALVWCCT